MSRLYGIIALAVASPACRHHAPPTQTAGTIPESGAAAAPAATTAPEVPPFLVQHNLASLLQVATGPNARREPNVYNGFFGPSHRRIEVAFTRVRRAKGHPNVYYVQGKNRYRGLITPFAGVLTLARVVEYLPAPTEDAKQEPAKYSVEGSFTLREEATRRHAGVFRGEAVLDIFRDAKYGLYFSSNSYERLTQTGAAKFEGVWQSNAGGNPVPVVWVDAIFDYGRQVLSDFVVGERAIDFNPKYAKLGWNTYWQNDEWWAESPKPRLALQTSW